MEKLLIAFYKEYVIMFIKHCGDRYQNTKNTNYYTFGFKRTL